MNKKYYVLGATFGTNNMGVGALTAGIIETILRQFPDAEIFLLDYGKERLIYQFQFSGTNIPIQLVNARFSKKIFLKNNIALLLLLSLIAKLVPFRKGREKIYSYNAYLRQIYEGDIFVSIAGGDSFSDIYGTARLLYVSLPQLLVLLMGKKLFILPQTLGPFKGKTAKLLASFILARAKVIYSRDHEGLEEMKELLGKKFEASRYKFCYDVGFVIDPVRPSHLSIDGINIEKNTDRPIVGMNVSGLLYIGGYTQKNMFGLKSDYRKLVLEVIEFIIKNKNANVLLVPHVFGSSINSESDAVACEKIYREMKPSYGDRISMVQGIYNQNEIKYIIGRCEFFIGSRMHACIAALSQSIPAVTIAYSRKFIGVLQSIGMESLVADPRNINSQEIIGIIDGAFEARGRLHDQLDSTIPEVKKTIEDLMRNIYLVSKD